MGGDILLDAGLFIGALLKNDPRHREALTVVDAARCGRFPGVTTIGILSEVYAALTWEGAKPQHEPAIAAQAILVIMTKPSRIRILGESYGVLPRMLELARDMKLHARRIHDARHAATALAHGVNRVVTYDQGDWDRFARHGMTVIIPRKLALNPLDGNA
jgi:predicted nucleic acid-binding protein